MRFMIGDRVERGPDWKYETQDCVGGVPVPGTVAGEPYEEDDGRTWVAVQWDGGRSNVYDITDVDGNVVNVIQHLGRPPIKLEKFFDL